MKQKEFFGFGSIKNLKQILKNHKPNKIFLVTGKKSYESSGAKILIDELTNNFSTFHFSYNTI